MEKLAVRLVPSNWSGLTWEVVEPDLDLKCKSAMVSRAVLANMGKRARESFGAFPFVVKDAIFCFRLLGTKELFFIFWLSL